MRHCDRGNHIFEPGYECCRAEPPSEAVQKAGIAAFYDYLDALPDDKSRPTEWPYSPAHITNALLDCINAVAGSVPSAPREASDLSVLRDTLHWLRGELMEIVGGTCGDDQYPWQFILGKLRALGAVDRGAPSPSAPTKHHDYRAPVCWCGERNSGGSTPEHEGNP